MGPPLPSTIHPLTHSLTHLPIHPSNQYVLKAYFLSDALRTQGWTSKEKDKTILGTAATIVKKDERRTWVEGFLYVGPSGWAWDPGRLLWKYLEWEWSGQLWQTTPKSQPLNTSHASLSLTSHPNCGWVGGPCSAGTHGWCCPTAPGAGLRVLCISCQMRAEPEQVGWYGDGLEGSTCC